MQVRILPPQLTANAERISFQQFEQSSSAKETTGSYQSSRSSGMLACLSRRRTSVRIRPGTLDQLTGTVRKLEK